MTVGAILLAGGRGTRMGHPTPKQFLSLGGKPLACHSLDLLLSIPEIKQIVVVVATSYRSLFLEGLTFAEPGERRQDSLFNGLEKLDKHHAWVLTHDAARPFFSREMVYRLIEEGKKRGAATLAVPLKPTIKECGAQGEVVRTLDRSTLVEIQTPQFLARELLERGFRTAQEKGVTVTDDTALAELVGHPVQTVLGGDANIKITTPEDLAYAHFLMERQCVDTR